MQAVRDIGIEDEIVTIDLIKAEKQTLQVQ